jgi:hypothetical protein
VRVAFLFSKRSEQQRPFLMIFGSFTTGGFTSKTAEFQMRSESCFLYFGERYVISQMINKVVCCGNFASWAVRSVIRGGGQPERKLRQTISGYAYVCSLMGLSIHTDVQKNVAHYDKNACRKLPILTVTIYQKLAQLLLFAIVETSLNRNDFHCNKRTDYCCNDSIGFVV